MSQNENLNPDLQKVALAALRSLQRTEGIEYADIRLRSEAQQALVSRGGELAAPLYQQPRGAMIRVQHGGRWGYVSTSLWDNADWDALAAEALEIARASALIPGPQVERLPVPSDTVANTSGFTRDPISVPIAEQRAVLDTIQRVLASDKRICDTFIRLDAVLRDELFASTDGAFHNGKEAICGLHYYAVACEGDLTQRRDSPFVFERRGWELIEALDLETDASRLLDRLLPLLDAAPCPDTVADVILAPSALAPILFETLGAALEVDRVLLGESPYSTTDKGNLVLTEGPLTVAADPAADHRGLGTYAYDDEGVPANDSDLVIDGRLVRFISDREHAARVPGHQPPGALRASGLNEVPLVRCPALRMEAGLTGRDELQAAHTGAFLVEGAISWELDPSRENLRLRAEAAWRLGEDGKPAELFRDPVLSTQTLDFWKRLEAVSSETSTSAIPWTAKGDPPQTAGVTISAPCALFRELKLEHA